MKVLGLPLRPAGPAGRAVPQLAALLGPAGLFASQKRPWVCRLRRPCYPSLSRGAARPSQLDQIFRFCRAEGPQA
ncbi:hypothetical protein SGRA_0641 [Saprospira grandis str. Lewin]|uniref:Uncharacterized protein n=1 Tax=Saprospira grandis (strain Lewin) TaxID=984262 RepID=H6L0F0_SAPGL|nr:hypothetical protein SGRA_0641 [Saprospira grandis str. Lewin]